MITSDKSDVSLLSNQLIDFDSKKNTMWIVSNKAYQLKYL